MKSSHDSITVLLADDHPLMRAGIKSLLEDRGGLTVIAESGSGIDTIKKYEMTHPDILILDITMPDMDGIEVCKQIKAYNPDARILILSMHPEKLFAARLLKAGALGYINKMAELSEIRNAVQTVADGRVFLSSLTADSVLPQLLKVKDKDNLVELLSDREIQVLSLVAQGKKLKEIADTLRLSIGTVANYRYRILQKLKLHSNADIIEFAHLANIL
jgi:DNA-binding NarL/FixJ family response regulator